MKLIYLLFLLPLIFSCQKKDKSNLILITAEGINNKNDNFKLLNTGKVIAIDDNKIIQLANPDNTGFLIEGNFKKKSLLLSHFKS